MMSIPIVGFDNCMFLAISSRTPTPLAPSLAPSIGRFILMLSRSANGLVSQCAHNIILSGEDKKGLLHRIINTLDENSAVIVRMNTEKITFPEHTQYISRFAISVREDNAPKCLSEIVKVAGEMKLTFRYETS